MFWLTMILLGAIPGIANANGNLTIVVKNPNPYTDNQSWYSFEKKPGETIDDVAVVKNLGDKPVKAHVYAVDATSNESGSFILKLENESRSQVGEWTKINSNDTVTIPPQQSVEFPFEIKIPDNLTPGQYFGGIVLEEVNEGPGPVEIASAADQNGQRICCTNIFIKTRIGLRIYLTIPGVVKESMDWLDFNTMQNKKNTSFQFKIKNTGNVAVEPEATIEIFDSFGNQVDRFQKSLGETLPGTTITPVITWDRRPLVGSFTATASLNYRVKSQTSTQGALHGSPTSETKKINFIVIPWEIMLIIALFLVALATGYGIFARNRHVVNANWEKYIVKTGDDIVSIAKNHGIDWKKLSKVNKLKAPYLVKENETVLVPKKESHEQPTLFDEKKHE